MSKSTKSAPHARTSTGRAGPFGPLTVRALAGAFAAQEESRPVLAGVHVDGPQLAAANGFTLGIVTNPHDDTVSQPEARIVPAKALGAFAASAKKDRVSVVVQEDEGRVDFATGVETANGYFPTLQQASRTILGTYPDYRQIVPKADAPCAEVALSAHYVIDAMNLIIAAAKDAGWKESRDGGIPARFRLYGQNQAVLITTGKISSINDDMARVEAVIMPMVIGPDTSGETLKPFTLDLDNRPSRTAELAGALRALLAADAAEDSAAMALARKRAEEVLDA